MKAQIREPITEPRIVNADPKSGFGFLAFTAMGLLVGRSGGALAGADCPVDGRPTDQPRNVVHAP